MMRLLGKWLVPVEQMQIKALLMPGALLVDVRSQHDVVYESLPGALNRTLE